MSADVMQDESFGVMCGNVETAGFWPGGRGTRYEKSEARHNCVDEYYLPFPRSLAASCKEIIFARDWIDTHFHAR